MAAEIGQLVEARFIRLLDLLILRKRLDAMVAALEMDGFDEVDQLRAADAQLAELLAEEDLADLPSARGCSRHCSRGFSRMDLGKTGARTVGTAGQIDGTAGDDEGCVQENMAVAEQFADQASRRRR